MSLHHLEQMKQDRIRVILNNIKKAGEAFVNKLQKECFHKLGMSPDRSWKYLKELEKIGEIKFSPKGDTVKYIGNVE